MEAFGLEGIIVAETALSYIDGDGGELVIAGRTLAELSRVSVDELASQLWGQPVSAADLGAGRVRAFARVDGLGGALESSDGMCALQAAIAQMPSAASAIDISSAIAVFAAAWHRQRIGLEPVPPDEQLDHGLDFLRMVGGVMPSPAMATAINRYLITVADHGVNASTFAARVVTSTGASTIAAIGAAIGALSGPLHGGAPGPVLDMLESCEGDPRRWLEDELAAGRRIMGMGHRVYRARDPRAAVLESAAEELERSGHRTRLATARNLESFARALLAARHPQRPLCANVELYTAVLLDALGLERSLFSPTFTVGRVIGWLGHIGEQRARGRLIRPASRYIGAMPGVSASSR